MTEGLYSYTVSQLKEMCKQKGLSTEGSKGDLIRRLGSVLGSKKELVQSEMTIYDDGKFKVTLKASGIYAMWEYEPINKRWFGVTTGDNKYMLRIAQDYKLPELLHTLMKTY